MSISISIPEVEHELKPRIIVVGVGGAGGNAVNNMIRSNLEGVEFLVANTDSQSLAQSLADRTIQLGTNITQGLGAGARPDIGRAAAEEGLDIIIENLQGSNMVFVTAGMGGGTGTGGGPVIARAARELGILTVGVVTKPFHFEGQKRMSIAEEGISELQQFVDTLIVIPNQNLFRVANEKTTFADAFKMADDVLHAGVRGVTDLMVMPGLINLDFADIRTVMSEMGKAMMGTGEGDGERRSIDAAEAAISNPLLEDFSMKGATGVLINITGGLDMTLFEVDEAANRIRDEVDTDANIIFGSTFDESLEGKMRVSVVATGIDVAQSAQPRPAKLSLVSERGRAMQTEAKPTAEKPMDPRARPTVTAQPAAVARPAAPAAPRQPAVPSVKISPAPAPASGARPVAQTGVQPVMAQGAPAHAAMAAAVAFQPQHALEPAEARPLAQGEPARQRQDAPFLAPRPISASDRPGAKPEAEPFAAAALANGAKEVRKLRRKGPTLFERVTGTGRAASREGPEPDRDDAEHRPPAQPRLGGLDPADRTPSSNPDDDLLDIPAFLRRQAN